MNAQLEEIRQRNRRAIGLAGCGPAPGMGACCKGCEKGGHCEGSALGQYTGQAAWAKAIPGMGASILDFAPPVRLVTAFPAIDVTYQPGQAEAPASTGPSWGDWVTRHVLRPEFYVGGIRVAPYENEADLSGLVEMLALGAAAIGAAFGGYTIYKAFFSGARV